MSNQAILEEIEYLERRYIYQNVSTFGDCYISIKKGEKQLKRDLEKAQYLRKAIEMD